MRHVDSNEMLARGESWSTLRLVRDRSRGSPRAALASLSAFAVAVLSAPSSLAQPRAELGAFGGVHEFAEESELGRTPWASESPFAREPALGLRLGLGLIGPLFGEAEIALIPASPGDTGLEALVLGWRAHLVVEGTLGRLRPFALVGAGGLTSTANRPEELTEETELEYHVGAGLALRLGAAWGLRADARLLVPEGRGVADADFELLGGLYVRFGDRPPQRAPVERDQDGDGIPDRADVCPYEAETRNAVRDQDGCPEDPSLIALLAEPLPQPEAPTDKDGDGVVSDDDACPNEAEDADQFEDGDGCPDPDNDGDGNLDSTDACPLEAETPNGYRDDDGCPDQAPPPEPIFTQQLEGIEFHNGSARIVRRSHRVLDEVARVLIDHPKVRVEIAGHTDDTGRVVDNLLLSRKRAEAVKTYLVSKGIAEDRLTAKGYGPRVPIADNNTREGRARNRRVEFNVLPPE